MSLPINKMTDRELLEGAYLAASKAETNTLRLTIQVEKINSRIGSLEDEFHHEVRRLDQRIDELSRRIPCEKDSRDLLPERAVGEV